MSSVAPLHRALLLVALGALAAVASFAAMLPPADAERLRLQTAVREAPAIPASAVVLPAPTTYIREERFGRGDTFADLLARLEIGAADAKQILALRQMRLLRTGSDVAAEVRENGELVWLAFAASRSTRVRLERVGEKVTATEVPALGELRTERRAAT